jgi:hypothetical protein
LIISELCNGEIETAVAIEISGPHIRDALGVLEDCPRSELLPPVVFEHDHGSDPVVVRKYKTHACNEQVNVAVTIHVRRLSPDWRFDARRQELLGELPAGNLPQPDDLIFLGVARDNVEQLIAVEVDGHHVCNPWRTRRALGNRLRLQLYLGVRARGVRVEVSVVRPALQAAT